METTLHKILENTGEYRSVKTRILVYFMECHVEKNQLKASEADNSVLKNKYSVNFEISVAKHACRVAFLF